MSVTQLIGEEARVFKPQYIELLASTFDDDAVARKEKAWDWLFDTPLAAEGHRPDLLVVYRGGAPVGASLINPMMLHFDGVTSLWHEPMGIVVHPDHRGAGFALLRSFFQLYWDLQGIPIESRQRVAYERFGDAHGTEAVNHFRPLRPGRILARRKGWKGLPLALVPIIDLIWQSGVRLMRLFRRPNHRFVIEEVTDFGPEFDTLWDEAGPSHPLIHRRNAAHLNWRFRDFPFYTYQSFLLRKGGHPVGYVVTRLEETGNRRNLLVTDIFCARGNEAACRALLFHAESVALRRGADQLILEAANKSWADGLIRKAGYHFRKSAGDILVRSDKPEKHARLAELVDEYHFCRSDNDEDF